MMPFLGFRQGMGNLGVCLKCWYSSVVGPSGFCYLVLPSMLQASKIRLEKKKRRVMLLSGEVELLLLACLFVFFLVFDCSIFSPSIQLALSLSSD